MKDFKKLREQISQTDPINILNHIGISFVAKPNSYKLRVREEKTASAFISKLNGKWVYKDFGSDSGGNLVNLVMDYLNLDFKEAVNLVEDRLNLNSFDNADLKALRPQVKAPTPKSKIISTSDLNQAAIDYLATRKIKTTPKELRLIKGEANNKNYYGLGIVNVSNGADIAFLKPLKTKAISIGTKDISLVGTGESLSVFESLFDYLSAFNQELVKSKALIANSVSNSKKVIDYLNANTFKAVIIYPQNDNPGIEFMQKIIPAIKTKNLFIFNYQKTETNLDINDLHKQGVDLRQRLKKYQNTKEIGMQR